MVSEAYAMAGNAAGQAGGSPGYEGVIMLVVMFAMDELLLLHVTPGVLIMDCGVEYVMGTPLPSRPLPMPVSIVTRSVY